MKIVTWNCNGGFTEKFEFIRKLDADVYVIQECREKDLKDTRWRDFSSDRPWVGSQTGQMKGVGILVKNGNRIENNGWGQGDSGYYVSCRINDSFDLLGVWAKAVDGFYTPYVSKYLTENKYGLNKNYIIAGDFNIDESVEIYSSKLITRETIRMLNSIGLYSAYHHYNKERHGLEKRKTYYRHKKLDKPTSHVDYIFADISRIKRVELMDPNIWLRMSDHVPLIVELN